MDFEAWFQYGIEQGWVTRVHDGVAVNPDRRELCPEGCCGEHPDVYQIRPLIPSDIK
jgi:hypothetical protein